MISRGYPPRHKVMSQSDVFVSGADDLTMLIGPATGLPARPPATTTPRHRRRCCAGPAPPVARHVRLPAPSVAVRNSSRTCRRERYAKEHAKTFVVLEQPC